MAEKAFFHQADQLVSDYLRANSIGPCFSILVGIFMSKMAYEVTHSISSLYFKRYSSLTKIQRIEWDNRGMSNLHAIFITAMSLYLVFFSELFSNDIDELVTLRSSTVSAFTLGVSVGYFITDLAMISWLYPSLGGMEYVLHHLLSITAISYAMLTGEGQLFTYMVLISETTTPAINLRWFLDVAGMKESRVYLINGVMIYVLWLVARILLFIYLFYNCYLYYEQIMKMNASGSLLTLAVPSVLFCMNLRWFTKIQRGLRKTLAKRD